MKVSEVRAMMQLLFDKTGQLPNGRGFKNMVDEMDIRSINEKYLYRNIHLELGKRKDSGMIGLSEEKVTLICNYLGYDSLRDFVKDNVESYFDAQLDSCLGTYYSYIRMSAAETVILRSPARILQKDRRYILEQKGARNSFTGEIRLRNGCLFILLASSGKSFYHVYKIGAMKTPAVIQGIFSGVSSSNDPIGGRVVLVRSVEDYKDLSTAAIEFSRKEKDPTMKALFNYFQKYEENNLAIRPTNSSNIKGLYR